MNKLLTVFTLFVAANSVQAENLCVNKRSKTVKVAETCPAGFRAFAMTTQQVVQQTVVVQGTKGATGATGLGVAIVTDANGFQLGTVNGEVTTGNELSVFNKQLNVVFKLSQEGNLNAIPLRFTTNDCSGQAYTDTPVSKLLSVLAPETVTINPVTKEVLVTDDSTFEVESKLRSRLTPDGACQSIQTPVQPSATFVDWLFQETTPGYEAKNGVAYGMVNLDPNTESWINKQICDSNYNWIWHDDIKVCWDTLSGSRQNALNAYNMAKNSYEPMANVKYASAVPFYDLPLQNVATPLTFQ